MFSIVNKSLTALLAFSCSLSVVAQKRHAPAKQKEYDKKVAAAMPTIKTAVRAKKARRILVLSKTMGWYHSSIETAKTCFKLMGPQSGAFKVDLSDEASDYTSENLKKYDAILFNNCTYVQEFFNAQQRQAVLGFVKNGGGFIGIHAAADCGTSARRPKSRWPEITELIGGAFNGHPWTNRGTYGVLNEDPKHPILKPLAGNNFQISDEFYKYKDYKRANQRVLLSIDMSTSYKKSGRADHDHALVWVKQYGKGRVFFSSLGHNEAIYYNPMILQMWLNGIQFALGDLSVATKALPQPEVNKSFKPKK